MIPYGRQEVTDEDIEAVVEVLKSDFLTQGPVVPRFEESVAAKVGSDYAVATNSATAALHVACLALGLGPGDWLWTSPITFVASANCGLYCGAKVDFVDIDPVTYNMSVASLTEKLALAEKRGCLPKIVIPVHLCGQSCEMREIHALSKRYGFSIIEDASHAIGGQYLQMPVGNCVYSDITVFSFHPVKIITTGEGGMACTNDSLLASRMKLFRSHGVTRDSDLMENSECGQWYYEQLEIGYNYRLTDIQAALGLSQLSRLDAYVAKRNEIAERYDEMFQSLPIQIPLQHPDSSSARHLYVIRLSKFKKSVSRDKVFSELRQRGIGVNIHYIPVHTQPVYRAMGFVKGQYPQAEDYYSEAISIPVFPTMEANEQDKVVSTIEELLLN